MSFDEYEIVNKDHYKPKSFKIVTFLWTQETKEIEFDKKEQSDNYWSNLSLFNASVYFKYDFNDSKYIVLDSYGVDNYCNSIIDEVIQKDLKNHYKHKKQNSNVKKRKFDDDTTVIDELVTPINEFIEFTSSLFDMNTNENNSRKIKNKIVSTLDKDDINATHLIISDVFGKYQCIFLYSFEDAKLSWNKLSYLYSSVWFKRQSNVWVLRDSYGTNDSIKQICWFVDEAQTTWTKNKNKKNIQKIDSSDHDKKENVKLKNNINENTNENNDLDDENDNKLCIFCWDNEKNHVVIPCGHLCLCADCIQLKEFSSKDSSCPMCRKKIEKIVKVFV